MKKLFLLILPFMLCSCLYAADNGDALLSPRRDFFTKINGYGIDFYNQEPALMKTELINEKNYRLNQSMAVSRGYSVLNNKIYRKDIYREVSMKPNKNGALNTGSIPLKVSVDKKHNIIGAVKIDGERYRLIEADAPNYAILIDDNGNFHKQIGEISGGTLVLLDPEYLPYPNDLKMVDVVSSKSTQTKPVQGFDVKYDGIKLDRMWFTSFDFANEEANRGSFKKFSFPNKPGLIEINGVGFRVLNASNDKIDYMVIKE